MPFLPGKKVDKAYANGPIGICRDSLPPLQKQIYKHEQKVLRKVDDSKRILAHEKFIEKIGNKVDRGHYSRWSNTLEIERASNANISAIQDNEKTGISRQT